MREIKFRAWDNKKKEWLMGYEMPNLGGFSLIGEMVLLGEWSQVIDKFLFSRDGYTPDDLRIMQYTGLEDKNGKEIYEGDIVHLTKGWHTVESDEREKDTGEDFIEGEIKYFIPYAGFGISGIGFDQLNLFPREIIGNIYENPYLLTPSVT